MPKEKKLPTWEDRQKLPTWESGHMFTVNKKVFESFDSALARAVLLIKNHDATHLDILCYCKVIYQVAEFSIK